MVGRIGASAWGQICVGALLLLAPAILNGFPFVFVTDSADYLILTPRVYRSPFYQMFVAITGLRLSPWPPVIAQAVLASMLIRLFLRLRGVAPAWAFPLTMAVLAGFSGLSIFTGFIMPDMFTGLMFLAVFMLLFDWGRLSRASRAFACGVALLSIGVHLSHFVMAAAMTAMTGLPHLALARSRNALHGMIAASLAVAVAGAAFVTYNAVVFHLPRLSPAGSVFLMANLIEHGPARDELTETCPRAGYRLCEHLHRLPPLANDLLWREGAFSDLGGFAGMREESGRIVGATFRHRPGTVIATSVRNVARALVSVHPAADIVVAERMPLVHAVIGLVFPAAVLRSFEAGSQARGIFPGRLFDALTLIGVLGAALTLGVLIARGPRRLDPMAGLFVGYAIAAYLGNAIVCATISGVWDRYQARIAWLPVLAVGTLALLAWQTRRGDHEGGGG